MATPEQYISSMGYTMSVKQRELLSIIARGNPDGSMVDRHQILERVSYTDDWRAVHFALRYMIAQGRVFKGEPEKRYKSRPVSVYGVTKLGQYLLTGDGENFSATEKPAPL